MIDIGNTAGISIQHVGVMKSRHVWYGHASLWPPRVSFVKNCIGPMPRTIGVGVHLHTRDDFRMITLLCSISRRLPQDEPKSLVEPKGTGARWGLKHENSHAPVLKPTSAQVTTPMFFDPNIVNQRQIKLHSLTLNTSNSRKADNEAHKGSHNEIH